jgi:death-on-curing protein
MRCLTLGEVVALQRKIIAARGGAAGIRDLRALESAVAQPRASVGGDGGDDLYPGAIEKAADGARGRQLRRLVGLRVCQARERQ